MGILRRIKNKFQVIGPGSPSQPISRPSTPPVARPPIPEVEKSPRGDEDPDTWIGKVVEGNEVVIFMKGNPSQPQCGFSANSVAILSGHRIEFQHVDVLLDPEVREQVKQYSGWPTLPQIYVKGEFVGGNDILQQLHDTGELATLLGTA